MDGVVVVVQPGADGVVDVGVVGLVLVGVVVVGHDGVGTSVIVVGDVLGVVVDGLLDDGGLVVPG